MRFLLSNQSVFCSEYFVLVQTSYLRKVTWNHEGGEGLSFVLSLLLSPSAFRGGEDASFVLETLLFALRADFCHLSLDLLLCTFFTCSCDSSFLKVREDMELLFSFRSPRKC